MWRFYIGIIYYSILVSLYYVMFYYRSFRTKLENEHRLQTLVKEAELKSLKYQIKNGMLLSMTRKQGLK